MGSEGMDERRRGREGEGERVGRSNGGDWKEDLYGISSEKKKKKKKKKKKCQILKLKSAVVLL